jgi:hypothetical protein
MNIKINNSTPSKLSKLMDDFEITVPLYQRNYTWKQENWDELYSDINSGKPIFLGTIFLHVTKEKKPRTAEVIDGQQRLTTVSLILNAIRLVINSDEKFAKKAKNKQLIEDIDDYLIVRPNNRDPYNKLTLQGAANAMYSRMLKLEEKPNQVEDLDSDIEVYEDLLEILNDNINEIQLQKNKLNKKKKKSEADKEKIKGINDSIKEEKEGVAQIKARIKEFKEEKKTLRISLRQLSEAETNIYDCTLFFYKKLKELKEEDPKNLLAFYKAVEDRLFVFNMETKDRGSLYDYFRTLNSSGVSLTYGEILKNDLFKRVPGRNSEKVQEQVVSDFDQVKDAVLGVGRSLEEFLLASLNAREDILEVAKKKKLEYPVPRKDMLRAYEFILKKDGSKGAENLIELLQASKISFLQMMNPQEELRMKEIEFYYYNVLKEFNISKPISLLMAAKKKCTTPGFRKLLKMVTYVCLKHQMDPHTDMKSLQRVMKNAFECLMENNWQDAIDSIKDDDIYESAGLTEDVFINHKNFATNKKSKALVCLLQSSDYISKHGLLDDYKKLSLEHIMPKTKTDYWVNPNFHKIDSTAVSDDDSYKMHVNRIGNHCVITNTDNNELKNKDYSIKRKRYKDNYEDLLESCIKRGSWTQNDIATRSKNLFKKFQKLGK